MSEKPDDEAEAMSGEEEIKETGGENESDTVNSFVGPAGESL